MSEIPTLKRIVEKEFYSWWGFLSGIAVIAAITGLNFLSIPLIYTIIFVGFIIIFFVARVMYKVSRTLAEYKPKPKDPRKYVYKNLEYKDVEFAIYYLTKKIDKQGIDNKGFFVSKDLFDWNNISGKDGNKKDEDKLREFLMYVAPSLKDVEVPWINNAKIEKINDNKEIKISHGEDVFCSIKLDDKESKAILTGPEQHGFRNYEFLARKNNGRTISQKYDPVRNIIIGVDRGGAVIGGMLAKNLGLAIKTLATAYAYPPKRDTGIMTSIRSGECLNNIIFEDVKRILLVDDAIRGGGSMKAARDMLYEKLYWFCWDKIPGTKKNNDNERLKEFLKQKLNIDWANTAEIKKSPDGKTIKVSAKKKSLELILNNEETRINIVDDINHEFIVKKVYGERNICKEKSFFDIEIKIVCILNEVGGGGRTIHPDFWVYEAKTKGISLPWDKMHWFEELLLEKDEIDLFNKIYDESQNKAKIVL